MAEPRSRADVECLAELARIAQLSAARMDRRLPDGLSSTGFETLRRLSSGPSSPLDLARALGVSKPAMTSALKTLQGRGWIAVAGDPGDGRRKRVSLTDAGLAISKAALAAVRPELEQLRAAFPAAEFEAALPFLRRLRAWMAAND